jgi:hypothetical protein
MVVNLPFPDSCLFPNRKAGRHYGTSVIAKTKLRDDSFYLTRQAMGGWTAPEGDIPLSLVFVTPTRHKRDWDGLVGAFKAAQDGMALAVGIDDSRFRPVLVDWVDGAKPGSVIAAIGVQIVSHKAIT